MEVRGSYRLVMLQGPTPNKVFEIRSDLVNIGRDISNEVIIPDTEVSRFHARLHWQPGGQPGQIQGYAIEDRGSTNGTFVNGLRLVNRRPLISGEIINFGEKISLRFETMPSIAPVAAPVVGEILPVTPALPDTHVDEVRYAPPFMEPVAPKPAYQPPAVPVQPVVQQPAYQPIVPVQPVVQQPAYQPPVAPVQPAYQPPVAPVQPVVVPQPAYQPPAAPRPVAPQPAYQPPSYAPESAHQEPIAVPRPVAPAQQVVVDIPNPVVEKPKNRFRNIFVGIGCLTAVICVLLTIFLIWVDQNHLWCQYLSWLPLLDCTP